uniref:BTB domain-containing protein n=1 Tax=Caenorhabditis tropicalis TaxID=1561998 RepID=A0A1I7UKT7_9PELO
MRDRRSYALNGLCFFENAKEHLEEDDFPEMPIGCIGGISGWHLCLDRISDGRMWYQPSIITNQTPQLQSRYYLDIVKNEGMINVPVVKRIVLNPSFGPLGPFISFDDLIDEKNGYLKFDGLIVEYGFQIEGMLDRDNIWTFNFDDRMFDCQKKANMISFYKDLENGGMKFFRCHKQLLTHHSTYFEFGLPGNRMIELNNEDLQYFDEFLQLSHGARIRQYEYTTQRNLIYAKKYELFNVTQFIDQAMKHGSSPWLLKFTPVTKYNLNHSLAHLLRKYESLDRLVWVLKHFSSTNMSGESMKKCVRRFLELV